jgi:hypothetical protein
MLTAQCMQFTVPYDLKKERNRLFFNLKIKVYLRKSASVNFLILRVCKMFSILFFSKVFSILLKLYVPAFSINASHLSASLTLTIRCSGAYKFEKNIACIQEKNTVKNILDKTQSATLVQISTMIDQLASCQFSPALYQSGNAINVENGKVTLLGCLLLMRRNEKR